MENKYEKLSWDKQQYVLGIDEAGRGPLAGELVVCGVVLPIDYENEAINDSKKLTAKKRQSLFETIKQDALEVIVEIVSIERIDQENIYQATKNAMIKIAEQSKLASVIVSDAMPFDAQIPVYSMVKADAKSISVAAASIIAKEIRDAMMINYSVQYPDYGFEKHKGYPTKQHIAAIEQFGILPIHRKTYQPVKGMIENDSKIKR